MGAGLSLLFFLMAKIVRYVFGLQVVNSPDTEGNSQGHPTEGENQDWGIPTI